MAIVALQNPTVELPLPLEGILDGVEMVLISHDHPDHIDHPAIAALPKSIQVFCQPGDEKRMDVGVVSDAVNTASRMEGLTKHFGASILVSESTLMGIENPQDFLYRFLGLVLVKGKQDPIGVYEFFEGDAPESLQLKEQTLPRFEIGLTKYFSRDFQASQQAFSEILEINPNDRVAQLYLERSQELIKSGVPQGWTGVESW